MVINRPSNILSAPLVQKVGKVLGKCRLDFHLKYF